MFKTQVRQHLPETGARTLISVKTHKQMWKYLPKGETVHKELIFQYNKLETVRHPEISPHIHNHTWAKHERDASASDKMDRSAC
jgi:hypothetical protein